MSDYDNENGQRNKGKMTLQCKLVKKIQVTAYTMLKSQTRDATVYSTCKHIRSNIIGSCKVAVHLQTNKLTTQTKDQHSSITFS